MPFICMQNSNCVLSTLVQGSEYVTWSCGTLLSTPPQGATSPSNKVWALRLCAFTFFFLERADFCFLQLQAILSVNCFNAFFTWNFFAKYDNVFTKCFITLGSNFSGATHVLYLVGCSFTRSHWRSMTIGAREHVTVITLIAWELGLWTVSALDWFTNAVTLSHVKLEIVPLLETAAAFEACVLTQLCLLCK